jgi:endonuclease/exonuclease/phosphatase family metal-dependent hydrolase
MRVVTLNTWKNEGDYLRRLPLMRDGLAAMAPDVVCLQECFVAEGFDTAARLAAELGLDLHPAPARAKPRRPAISEDANLVDGHDAGQAAMSRPGRKPYRRQGPEGRRSMRKTPRSS